MPKHGSDEQFEIYLKQYRPLAPPPLVRGWGDATRGRHVFAALVAVAAAILVGAILTSHRRARPNLPAQGAPPLESTEPTTNPGSLTLGGANALFAHAESLEAALDRLTMQSRDIEVPEGKQSAFAVLGQEGLNP